MSKPPKLYTATEALAELLTLNYPGIEVIVTEPLPTTLTKDTKGE